MNYIFKNLKKSLALSKVLKRSFLFRLINLNETVHSNILKFASGQYLVSLNQQLIL